MGDQRLLPAGGTDQQPCRLGGDHLDGSMLGEDAVPGLDPGTHGGAHPAHRTLVELASDASRSAAT